MNKLIESIKRYPKSFIISGIIGVMIGFIVFAIFYFAIGGMTLIGAINGTGVGAVVVLAIFAFAWLGRNGAYDTMSYGFKQMFTSMFGKNANKYHDFNEYKNEKNAKREFANLSYFSYLAVSFLYAIPFAILEILLHTQY